MIAGEHEAGRQPMRRVTRVILVFAALAALILPTAYLFISFWTLTGEQAGDVAAERRALHYLRPVGSLVGVLADTQHAAVDKKSVDAARVRAAIAKVDAADRKHGAALGVHTRWRGLKQKIEQTLDSKPTGAAARRMYGNVSTLALALVTKLGHSSALTADKEFDARATVLRVPAVIVYSAELVDLLNPAAGGAQGGAHHGGSGGHGESAGEPAGNRTERPADKPTEPSDKHDPAKHVMGAEVSAVAEQVSHALDQIREGLRSGGGNTVTGSAGLEALDEFSAAVRALLDAVAPAATGEAVSVGDADDAEARVRNSARSLHEQMIESLSSQLTERASGLTAMRFGAAAAVVVGFLLAAVLLWFSLPTQADARAAPAAEPAGPYQPAEEVHAADAESPEVPPDLVDARELLNSEELLHVGRAVRAVRGEPDDGSR